MTTTNKWLTLACLFEGLVFGFAWALPIWRFALMLLCFAVAGYCNNRAVKSVYANRPGPPKASSQPLSFDDVYPTKLAIVPKGPQDAIEILTQDRDVWKQKAAQAELQAKSNLESTIRETRESIAKQLLSPEMGASSGASTWPTRFRIAEMIRKGEV